ncbi:MAG: hypothetical protein C4527_06625 [Candidatus Omnitrophota bacterium]|nr:MAG: hypothetical protein C4527_06625 [Candidatus Omnitrophota bacterium]
MKPTGIDRVVSDRLAADIDVLDLLPWEKDGVDHFADLFDRALAGGNTFQRLDRNTIQDQSVAILDRHLSEKSLSIEQVNFDHFSDHHLHPLYFS